MGRHQHPRQYRRHRHRAESRHLRDRHVPPARITRHNLRHVRIDHHNPRPNAHAREEPHRNQPARRGRERPRQRKRRINQQQRDERNSPPHPVAAHSEKYRPEKHSQKSGSHKQAELFQGKKPGLLQRCPDVRHDENVVEIEKIPQRYQRNEPPMESAKRQPLNPCRNRRANVFAGRNRHSTARLPCRGAAPLRPSLPRCQPQAATQSSYKNQPKHNSPDRLTWAYFIRSTTPIFSSACKYSSTISTGTGRYSAETASRISCVFRFPFAKFSTSYAYSSPPPHNPSYFSNPGFTACACFAHSPWK